MTSLDLEARVRAAEACAANDNEPERLPLPIAALVTGLMAAAGWAIGTLFMMTMLSALGWL